VMMAWRDICKMGGGYGLQALCMLGDVLIERLDGFVCLFRCLFNR
jgi:hypothetical protein